MMESNAKTAEIFLGSHDCSILKESDTAESIDKSSIDAEITENVNSNDNSLVLNDNNNVNVSGSELSETKDVPTPKKLKSRGSKELVLLLNSLRDSNFNPISNQKRKKVQNYNKFMESRKHEAEDETEDNSKKKKRKESIDNTNNQNVNSSTSNKQSLNLERKKSFNNSKDLKDQKDGFCWYCHREGQLLSCQACPRSFHHKCLDSHYTRFVKNTCPECMAILKAESIISRSFAMKNMTIDQFCELLKYAVKKVMMCEGSDPFMHPVDATEFPDYCNYIVNPMDISKLEKNIIDTKYGSTEAFIADVKWIVHNSIIFNSVQSKITTYARNILRICKLEMAEIENCYECYLRSNICASDWFVEACTRPHILLWAKLKGFPFWPAKAMSYNEDNADVRFFGAHDRAWVPLKECFLYSEKIPSKRLSKNDEFLECLQEVTRHIKKLEEKFGRFQFAPIRTPFNPSCKNQINIILPNYTVEEDSISSIKDISKSPTTPLSRSVSPKVTSKNIESRNNSFEKNITRRSRRSNELIDGYGSDDEDLRNNNLLNLEARKKFISLDNSSSESEHSDKLIIDNSLTNETIEPVRANKTQVFETKKKKISQLPTLLSLSSINANQLDKKTENSNSIKTETITEDVEKPPTTKSIIGKEVVAKLTKTVNGVSNMPKISIKNLNVSMNNNETKSITKTIPTLVNSKSGMKIVNFNFNNVNGIHTSTSSVNKKSGKNTSNHSGIIKSPIKYSVASIQGTTIAPSSSTSTISTTKPKLDDTRTRYATDEIPADFQQTSNLQKKVNDIFDKSNKQNTIPKSATVTQASLPEATRIIDLAAMKMNFFFKSVATEIMKEVSEKSKDTIVQNLENEIESLKKAHNEELNQIKSTVQITVREMYKAWVYEKTKAIEDIKAKCEIEKNKAIAETKTKSWYAKCVNCQKEAQFYCCWNTSYCDYPCQINHWDIHKKTCNRCPTSDEMQTCIKKENTSVSGDDSNSVPDQEVAKDSSNQNQ